MPTWGPSAYSRPAAANGTDSSKKRKPHANPDEPIDDSQFGVSPKAPKVKKAIIVSGGLCGFKVRIVHPRKQSDICCIRPASCPVPALALLQT